MAKAKRKKASSGPSEALPKGDSDVPTKVSPEVLELDQYLCGILDLIPADKYIKQTDAEKEEAWLSGRFAKNKKGSAPKQQIKNSTKQAKRRAKFNSEGVVGTYGRLAEASRLENADKDDDGTELGAAAAIETAAPLRFNFGGADHRPASSHAELRERMARKLEELQAKRKNKAKNAPGSGKSKASSRRKEGRANNDGSGAVSGTMSSSLQSPLATASGGDASSAPDLSARSRERLRARLSGDDVAPESFGPSGEKLTFGLLDIDGTGEVLYDGEHVRSNASSGKKRQRPWSTDGGAAPAPGKRNPLNVRKLLSKAQANQAKLEKLRSKGETGIARAEAMANAQVWNSMERRAQGEAVRDDPKLLAKTLKRAAAKKKKSQMAWKLRKGQEQSKIKDSHDKRAKNIAAAAKKRVDQKLKRKGLPVTTPSSAGNNLASEPGEVKETRKTRRLKKQQKRRPGFEGKPRKISAVSAS